MTRFLLRLAFSFEPLAPTAISYFLSRSLRDWEQQGLISDFKAHTKRLGKFHYRMEIDMDVNEQQAHYLLGQLLPKKLEFLGRWSEDV